MRDDFSTGFTAGYTKVNDMICNRFNEFNIMLDYYGCLTVLLQRKQNLNEFVDIYIIQARRRFIKNIQIFFA